MVRHGENHPHHDEGVHHDEECHPHHDEGVHRDEVTLHNDEFEELKYVSYWFVAKKRWAQ